MPKYNNINNLKIHHNNSYNRYKIIIYTIFIITIVYKECIRKEAKLKVYVIVKYCLINLMQIQMCKSINNKREH